MCPPNTLAFPQSNHWVPSFVELFIFTNVAGNEINGKLKEYSNTINSNSKVYLALLLEK